MISAQQSTTGCNIINPAFSFNMGELLINSVILPSISMSLLCSLISNNIFTYLALILVCRQCIRIQIIIIIIIIIIIQFILLLRLGDEAIRVAVGLRLWLKISEPHSCPCGVNVDAQGLHGLACKRSAGRSTRHQQLNDLIWRALKRADIPSTKKPTELLRGDGKRRKGLTLVHWQAGKCLTWDATGLDTLASSYAKVTAAWVRGEADAAAERKSLKYASNTDMHIFVPVAIETLGPICSRALSFLV